MLPGEGLAAREHAFSPSRWARDFEATLDRQAALGERLRESHPPKRLVYGTGPQEGLNLFVPEGEGPWPLMVFLHGGYWQELSAFAIDFMAFHWLEQGWAFASMDYPLAPNASIETMVASCRQGVKALRRESNSLGLNGRIHLGGHSAGAQLALMSCLGPERLSGIESLLLASGIYDLRPLVGTYIDAPLGLDTERAERLSPLCQALQGLPPLQLVHGEFDPPAFRAQGQTLKAMAQVAGVEAELCTRPECDHFDVIEYINTSFMFFNNK
ncbi:alpha/beta hydrolase [Vreelandella venusta]|uniref:Alpha/beta hydrolase n=1 Tax=Vreelandella venusta TaxID=44935 RepID=A0AAQ0CHL0_9GAMM|nr:alpha/beta hydrolase [Halomonas venusta]MBR9924902.1 alpha/beta hydrolase [Gammaproteobacteria bacterium]MDX1712232.1 alpha/beta hydrolase [Halomonas venusta]QRL03292.1 alpha/beta hydrolase [Halomonas venusta]GEK49858.1 alpha/beta hydrolase [Halomonas venusta]